MCAESRNADVREEVVVPVAVCPLSREAPSRVWSLCALPIRPVRASRITNPVGAAHKFGGLADSCAPHCAPSDATAAVLSGHVTSPAVLGAGVPGVHQPHSAWRR
jgi:hypothetical protein